MRIATLFDPRPKAVPVPGGQVEGIVAGSADVQELLESIRLGPAPALLKMVGI